MITRDLAAAAQFAGQRSLVVALRQPSTAVRATVFTSLVKAVTWPLVSLRGKTVSRTRMTSAKEAFPARLAAGCDFDKVAVVIAGTMMRAKTALDHHHAACIQLDAADYGLEELLSELKPVCTMEAQKLLAAPGPDLRQL